MILTMMPAVAKLERDIINESRGVDAPKLKRAVMPMGHLRSGLNQSMGSGISQC